jgi:hypothetical protein
MPAHRGGYRRGSTHGLGLFEPGNLSLEDRSRDKADGELGRTPAAGREKRLAVPALFQREFMPEITFGAIGRYRRLGNRFYGHLMRAPE